MSEPDSEAVALAIAQLDAKDAMTRKRGAKALRRLRAPEAGPALLTALRRELEDASSWETQYHLIMALAESGHGEALPELQELALRDFEATMLYTGLGHAIVALGRESEHDAGPVLELLATGNRMLIDGAFRGMAMLRMVPPAGDRARILDFAAALAPDDHVRFWVAAACPGWDGEARDAYLDQCVASPRADISKVAVEAKAGKYRAWKPL